MRVYSLYLSTLTGTTNQAQFTATITTAGTILNVSAVVAGSNLIAVGQNVVISGVVYQIATIATGAGAIGTYTLSTPYPPVNAVATTYYTYTTNNNSKYAPVYKNNLANVKWNINWREIFGNRQGECRVRCRFISASSTSTLTWAANVGSIRATIASSTTNASNGFNIGFVRPQNDFTGTSFTYLDCDTTTSNGTTMIIPNSNNDLTIMLINAQENFMTNMCDYQIWLYFDVDDEDPLITTEIGVYNTDSVLPTIFNPR